MSAVLLAWIGQTDLDCASGGRPGRGPIGSVVAARRFDALVLLSNYPAQQNRAFIDWLVGAGAPSVHLRTEVLTDPTDYGAVHAAAVRAFDFARGTVGAGADLTVHVSPGTPAMQAVWVLLAKTRHPVARADRRPHGLGAVRHRRGVRAGVAARRRREDRTADLRAARGIARVRPDRRSKSADGAGEGPRAARRPARRHRPDRGRVGHRQRAVRPRHPRREPPGPGSVRGRQLRRAAGGAGRAAAFRPRAGRFLRRRRRPAGRWAGGSICPSRWRTWLGTTSVARSTRRAATRRVQRSSWGCRATRRSPTGWNAMAWPRREGDGGDEDTPGAVCRRLPRAARPPVAAAALKGRGPAGKRTAAMKIPPGDVAGGSGACGPAAAGSGGDEHEVVATWKQHRGRSKAAVGSGGDEHERGRSKAAVGAAAMNTM